jgi:hypothetical protein
MNKRRKTPELKPKLTQDQIDRFLTAEAEKESAWEKPVVRKETEIHVVVHSRGTRGSRNISGETPSRDPIGQMG